MLSWNGKSLLSAHYASNISITSMDITTQFIVSYPTADISPFFFTSHFIFYFWLIFAERVSRSIHSPFQCTLRPGTCAPLGLTLLQNRIWQRVWPLKWKNLLHLDSPISSSATWWEVNIGLNTWCDASFYLLMLRWMLKFILLMVDLCTISIGIDGDILFPPLSYHSKKLNIILFT